MYEFLPLCDVLFNIISLASYFCDVVFDVLTAYTLYMVSEKSYFFFCIGCILFSLVVSQICSFLWYYQQIKEKSQDFNLLSVILIHVFQAGILFRYFRLFMPVDLRYVKNDVRDLCILRLVHAFCEAAPMLLIQLYLIWLKPSISEISDLNIVSTVLSLFSVCWALASFNKYVRRHNVHRLIMTWLGVIFQLLWRLGTITSRALALSVYATLYGYWVLLVIFLHWVSMFLWLISPKNVFHGEKMPLLKKMVIALLIAFCYTFCYINFQESNSRQKVIAFYFTMALENTLLISVWLGGLHSTPWYQHGVTALMFISFILGMVFMVLYYRHFHVRRLQYTHNVAEMNKIYSSCSGCQIGDCSIKGHDLSHPPIWNELSAIPVDTSNVPKTKLINSCTEVSNRPQRQNREAFNVPGVFNCRFNPVIKRKRKKPTSFIPPPVTFMTVGLVASSKVGKMQHPFWKRPSSHCVPSNNHESNGNTGINIRQKLLEKKEQQVVELRKIEEEIRVGKLKRPLRSDITASGTLKRPIPLSKKSPWGKNDSFENNCVTTQPLRLLNGRKPRSQTPEILLGPHNFENNIYHECLDPRLKYVQNYHLDRREMNNSSISHHLSTETNRDYDDLKDNDMKGFYKSYRITSDIDSQISLPRSYTLPREFKYKRQKRRKILKMEHFLTSTNSSDGDVDSADENDTSTFEDPGLNYGPEMVVHPGHNHRSSPFYHHCHHHQLRSTGGTTPCPPSDTTSRPNPPFKTPLGLTNTHETKL